MRPLALLLLALLAAPCLAQAPEDDEPSPLVGAAWCAVKPISDREAPKEDALGCDGGLGAALLRYKRLAWVAVVGTQSLGTGLAWVINPGARSPVAVALGFGVPWDANGIYMDPALMVGGTISWKGGE